MMQTVCVTGGTGVIGRSLVKRLLKKGYRVIVLTRTIPVAAAINGLKYALWDVKQKTIDVSAIQEADHIIHLAGAGVMDKRWSDAYKKEIQQSRIKSSELLMETLKQYSNKVQTIVCASAIGWYGADVPGMPFSGFTENDPPQNNFLGETCRLWEQSIDEAIMPGRRVVKLRTGIVVSNDGGAFTEFKKPLQFGIAPILGNGKQVISWIHIDDLCRLYIEALTNQQLQGAYNAVAPEPVSNKTLMLTLAQSIRKKLFIPVYVPSFILKIILGESSIEILKSTTVSCKKIQQSGFTFLYPSWQVALKQLCQNENPGA